MRLTSVWLVARTFSVSSPMLAQADIFRVWRSAIGIQPYNPTSGGITVIATMAQNSTLSLISVDDGGR